MTDNSLSNHAINAPSYIVDGDPGRAGGGTYTAPSNARMDPTIQDYENIFGPAARDVKLDLQRNKRHARWHLPDALKGSNPWIADKIDGLITDTSTSPFTTTILPYMYIENVDQKIKWNRWSFDEGLSSRVPYESAARTLTQTKTSYAGYTVRQGLAITLEHNFMMSPKGRENFKNQLQQVVGSIQYTNDIDVHIALITAPSYAKEKAEKYFTRAKTNHQIMREYIDLFGFMQKNPNAMDIMIEEARALLRSWGAAEPSFLLTNSKLTFQMTMLPEKTEYVTQGPDGSKRLKSGPSINSYRGLNIINSRSFSLEDGAPPRDVLRRRVRTAEYYRIPWSQGIEQKDFSFYDESKDSWQKFSWKDLSRMADAPTAGDAYDPEEYTEDQAEYVTKLPDRTGADARGGGLHAERVNMRLHPNIVHDLHRIEFLTGYRNNATAAMGPLPVGGPPPTDPWTALFMLTRNAEPTHLPPPRGAIYEPFTVDKILSYWGLEAATPSSEAQDAYQQLADDFKDFLFGNLRGINVDRRGVFERLDVYDVNKLAMIIQFLYLGTPEKTSVNDPPRQYLARFADGRDSTAAATAHPGVAAPAVIPAAPLPAFPAPQLPDMIRKVESDRFELVIVRPNIEHEMLGIVMGRGGVDELGATLWGQTELSVYDDSMHGIWGMSYKYNERAIVFNHKNLVRLWDIAYDGYNGGKDCTHVEWHDPQRMHEFWEHTYELNRAYDGVSMMVMKFRNVDNSDPWPSPIVFHDASMHAKDGGANYIDGEHQHQVKKDAFRVFNRAYYEKDYKNYLKLMPNFSKIHNPKNAGTCSEENETSCNCLAFQGTMRIHSPNTHIVEEISGNGHHGVDAVGMASVRAGKGISMGSLHSASAQPIRIA